MMLVLIPMDLNAKKYDFDWKMISDDDGIKTYEAINAPKDIGIIPLKVQAVMKQSLTKVLTVLKDPKRKKQWVPMVKEYRTIERFSICESIEYSSFKAPWPLSDRDFVINVKTSYDLKDKSIYATIESTNHPQMPENVDHVRGFTYQGDAYLKMIDGNNTFLEISFFTDFKGWIPRWIINMVQTNWPRDFIKHLERQLSKSDIVINSKYDFLIDENLPDTVPKHCIREDLTQILFPLDLKGSNLQSLGIK